MSAEVLMCGASPEDLRDSVALQTRKVRHDAGERACDVDEEPAPVVPDANGTCEHRIAAAETEARIRRTKIEHAVAVVISDPVVGFPGGAAARVGDVGWDVAVDLRDGAAVCALAVEIEQHLGFAVAVEITDEQRL